MKLDNLLKNLEYTCIQGSISGVEVSRIVYDSRKASEGDLFVCISGAVSDGHSFAREVAEKGVSVIVAEKPVDVPASVTVIQTEDSRISETLQMNL